MSQAKFTSVTEILNFYKPTCKSENELIILVIHCLMKLEGFTFVSCDENDTSSSSENTSSNNNNTANRTPNPLASPPSLLPSNWNNQSGVYTLVYTRNQQKYVIKGLSIGGQLLVHGLAAQHPNTVHNVEITRAKYVADNAVDPTQPDAWSDLNGLIEQLKSKVILKLGSPSASAPETDPQRPYANKPSHQPLVPPSPDYYPDDDYDPLRVGPPHRPSAYPTPYGDQDLFPSGPMAPFSQGSGGSHIGPQHPIFGNQDPFTSGQDPFGFGGNRGRGGNRGFGPNQGRGNGPRGANPRFDPFGPPSAQSYDPDNDESPPPTGFNNMFL